MTSDAFLNFFSHLCPLKATLAGSSEAYILFACVNNNRKLPPAQEDELIFEKKRFRETLFTFLFV